MASIQSLGIGSGLLTSELLEDIISAEREATDLRLEARRLEVNAEISAFGSVRSELERLRSATAAIASSTEFISNTTTSSNPAAVTAVADGEARVGVNTVEVLALARAQALSSASFDSPDATIGQGTLTFQFGTTTFDEFGEYDSFTADAEGTATTITIDASNNTLAGLRDAVNAAGFGVTASIVDDGTGSVLVFRSDSTGLEQSVEIVVSEDGSNPGLSAFAFSAGAATAGDNLTQIVAADDAVVRVDGLQVQRESNTISDVVPGVTFTAVGLNVGAPATVSVNQDVAAIQGRMEAFVEAFNSVKVLTDELTDFDTETEQGALLTGDSTLRTIRTQLQRFLATPVDNLSSDRFRGLVDLGLKTDRGLDFLLSFDINKFNSLLAEDTDAVTALLTDEARSTDSQIEFRAFGSATQAGSYAVEIAQVATSGRNTGATVAGLAGSTVIDADNDTFELSVDGVSSGTIQLTLGSYADGAELAQEIEVQINADTALRNAGAVVDVRFDTTSNQLVVESERLGSTSVVAITSVDTSTAATLGITVNDGTAEAGQDVAGTVGGVAGVGTGAFLQIPTGPAPALAARLDGGELSFPLTVAGGSDSFTLTVDGTTSGSLVVPAATYNSPGELVSAVQAVLDADTALGAADVGARVRYDAGANRLVFETSSTGAASSLRLNAIDENLATQLGFAVGQSATGTAAGRSDSPVGGIQLQVTGGETGSRGEVVLARGAMNRLDRFLDALLASDGSLASKDDGLDARLAEIDEEAADFDARMDALEQRLRLQFASADALISQLNNTSQFLDQQIPTLPGFARDDG